MITFYDALTTTVALTALLLLVSSVYLIFKAKMRPTARSLALTFYLKFFPLRKTSLPS